jgi:hypothetical protein
MKCTPQLMEHEHDHGDAEKKRTKNGFYIKGKPEYNPDCLGT